MMNRLILFGLFVCMFFVFIGCFNKGKIEKIKSECSGSLMMLYSGCHCYKQLGNDSTDIVPVDLKEKYCKN